MEFMQVSNMDQEVEELFRVLNDLEILTGPGLLDAEKHGGLPLRTPRY